MSKADARLPLVCLLVSAETSPSVLYGLFDVLGSVGAAYTEMTTAKPGEPLLDVQIVAATAKPFRCYGNVFVEPHRAIDDVDKTDVAVVCDMYQPIDSPPRGRYQREVDWLNLETAVGREKDVHDIDVHGRFEKLVVTLLVMRAFSNFPGALRACAYFRDPTAVSRLKRVHANGALIASVCSGSLILAEAGLLDGLEAAGHWAYRDMFRDHYPKVELKVG